MKRSHKRREAALPTELWFSAGMNLVHGQAYMHILAKHGRWERLWEGKNPSMVHALSDIYTYQYLEVQKEGKSCTTKDGGVL